MRLEFEVLALVNALAAAGALVYWFLVRPVYAREDRPVGVSILAIENFIAGTVLLVESFIILLNPVIGIIGVIVGTLGALSLWLGRGLADGRELALRVQLFLTLAGIAFGLAGLVVGLLVFGLVYGLPIGGLYQVWYLRQSYVRDFFRWESEPLLLGPQSGVVLEVKNLTKHFEVYERGVLLRRKIGDVHAVDNVSFSLNSGETLGLVGESGCGKSTIAKCVLYLEPPTSGTVIFREIDITHAFAKGRSGRVLALRRQMQYIFQNPYASLDPRMTVADIIMEPLAVHRHIPGDQWLDRMYQLLRMVGLEDYHAERYPHEFSGGQRQRICIARALAVEPKLIVADEPVASLDVSVRAQILNLLRDLQQQLGLTYLYISHDLSTVRHICDRVAVMYLGKLVEVAETEELFENPLHPYTVALMSAIPIPDPKHKTTRIILPGEVPSPISPPTGCRFHPRCSRAIDVCSKVEPEQVEVLPGHWLACYNPWPSKSAPAGQN